MGEGCGKSGADKALPFHAWSFRSPGVAAHWFIIRSRSPTDLALCVVRVAEVTLPRRSNMISKRISNISEETTFCRTRGPSWEAQSSRRTASGKRAD